MPKVLTDAQVRSFETQGFLSPIRAVSPERAAHYRERFESLEACVPGDIKKMKTKSHLLSRAIDTLSAAQARRIALAAQGFGEVRPAARPGPTHLLRAVECLASTKRSG